ncbi:nucleotidyl transferase AbiEii/AbiGii toxin family protein [Candidatus Paracaedibacter symbiosus]|uniref:nucleotidyl transferase AbiEii/AbiGii toxin family protein n=1 Tax=Candidatus Paracaedibacter symbiosus TaxID=244582 RepID=UPI00050998AD|nr:nucleotidyl transferase AbiEii/AbiGii toxin family protein [Candidatus Paracaedibacter symbiosus]
MLISKLIEEQQEKTSIDRSLIEQDYAISWLLYGFSKTQELRPHLVLKGGTCLRKCYFDDYNRFSQDIDFSVIGDYPNDDELNDLIRTACQFTEESLQRRGHDVSVVAIPIIINNLKNFLVSFRYPWEKEYIPKITIELSFPKGTYFSICEREITPPYNEPLHALIKTYSLEEIVCDKISELLDFSRKIDEGKWVRHRGRDYYDLAMNYYDLWHILHKEPFKLDKKAIPDATKVKCLEKSILFESIDDLFNETLMKDVDTFWKIWIKQFVPDSPPPKKQILQEVRESLKEVFR